MSLEALKLEIEKESNSFADVVAKKAVAWFAKEFGDIIRDSAGVPAVGQAPKTTKRANVDNGSSKEHKPCKAEGCGLFAVAKGLCSKHYQKARNKAKAKAKKAAEVAPAAAEVAPNGSTEPQSAAQPSL